MLVLHVPWVAPERQKPSQRLDPGRLGASAARLNQRDPCRGLHRMEPGARKEIIHAMPGYPGYRVCAKFIGEKPAGYQPAARCSQNSSQRPMSWEQRRAIIALAWLTVQRIPDCLSRCPMIVLQPASTTPEPTKRPWLRNWA